MKEVIISIKGIQDPGLEVAAGGDPIELITGGQYSHRGNETIFSYMETEMTGMEGTKTTFSVKPDMVILTREGTTSSKMVFEQGKKHVFLYETPYGATSMGVDTHRIRTGIDDVGGDIEIEYTLDVDNRVVSQNSFLINIRENTGKLRQ